MKDFLLHYRFDKNQPDLTHIQRDQDWEIALVRAKDYEEACEKLRKTTHLKLEISNSTIE